MDRSKIQFDFLCFIPCKSPEESYEGEIASLGGKVFFIPKPGSSIVSIKKLDLFFRQRANEYTWLHNHEVYLSVFLRPLSAHYGIQNFVIHSHTTKYSDQRLPAIRNAILCFPIRFMRSKTTFKKGKKLRLELLACSNAAGIFLFGNKRVTQGRVSIFYNAIDTKKYQFDNNMRSNLQKTFGIEKRFVIGHVGRFVPQKNHEFIVSLFAKIIEHWKINSTLLPRPLLLLIGDGPRKHYVEQMVHEFGIGSDVCFLGQRPDVPQLYNLMDVFILPSRYEGLPVSCIEAQANGLECLVSQEITSEIAFTKYVHFLSIDKGISSWEQVLLSKAAWTRSNDITAVPDIKKEAIELMKFYLP